MEAARGTAVAAIAGVALAAAACAHRHGPADDLARSSGVEIVGARAFDRDAIAYRVHVTGTSPRPAAEDVDVRAVRELYASAGYLEAKVEVAPVGDGAGRIRFQVRIVEGRLARVERLTLDGLDAVPEAGPWSAALPLRPGSAFGPGAYQLTIETLRAALHGAGYHDADVIHASSVDPRSFEARVSIFVDPGPRGEPYRFGPLFVWAPAPEDRDRIRRAVEPLVPRGGDFDVTRLEAVRRRLGELGFRRAEVKPGTVSEPQREIPVVVLVAPH